MIRKKQTGLDDGNLETKIIKCLCVALGVPHFEAGFSLIDIFFLRFEKRIYS